MIGTERMSLGRAARITRKWAENPATQLGAELHGLTHPLSFDNGYTVARMTVSAFGGEPYWPIKPKPAPPLPKEGLRNAISAALAKKNLTLGGN